MIEYSNDIIEHSKELNNRFLILKMRDLCEEKARKYIDTTDIIFSFAWFDMKRDFNNLLILYDSGNVKVNDNVLRELYYKLNNMVSPPKPIVIQRIMKIITLV